MSSRRNVAKVGVKGALSLSNQAKMQKTFGRLRPGIRNPLLLAALRNMGRGRCLTRHQWRCLGAYIDGPGCGFTDDELVCVRQCLAQDPIADDEEMIPNDDDEVASTDGNEAETADTKGEAGEDDGVLLLEVKEKAAAGQAGLRAGDVILSFNGVRVRTFAELRDAVQQANGAVKVVFINGENNAVEYLTVEPQEGRIGVTCE